MKKPRIHLIEKRFDIEPSAEGFGLHESCCWKYLDEVICQRLIGGKVYFHPIQVDIDKAYMSGTIVSFKPAGKKRKNSVIIIFRKDEDKPGDETIVENPDDWQPTNLGHKGIHPYRQIIL